MKKTWVLLKPNFLSGYLSPLGNLDVGMNVKTEEERQQKQEEDERPTSVCRCVLSTERLPRFCPTLVLNVELNPRLLCYIDK